MLRYITRAGRFAYILDARGQLHCVPLIVGQSSFPLDADLAANSLRRAAIEFDAEGNWSKAAAHRRAAIALDALVDLPEASAA
jgi:hypothetical protein